MATTYHYEALRRQRIIDRAAEARKKLEETPQEAKEEITAEKTKHSKQKRHKKAHKTSSDHHHKKQLESSFPGSSKRQKVESLETPKVSVKSQDMSQEISKSSAVEGSVYSISTTPHDSEMTHTSRHFNNEQSRVSTVASESTTVARSRRSSASNSITSYCSTPSTAQLKADAIRKDLERQERILHDSNLVMGTTDMEEETKLQQAEGGI